MLAPIQGTRRRPRAIALKASGPRSHLAPPTHLNAVVLGIPSPTGTALSPLLSLFLQCGCWRNGHSDANEWRQEQTHNLPQEEEGTNRSFWDPLLAGLRLRDTQFQVNRHPSAGFLPPHGSSLPQGLQDTD